MEAGNDHMCCTVKFHNFYILSMYYVVWYSGPQSPEADTPSSPSSADDTDVKDSDEEDDKPETAGKNDN